MNSNPYILGLDVGTNSIGWAVVDCEKEQGEHQGIYAGYKSTSLRALNSRIFLEMVEAKNEVPKNQKRRMARGACNRRAYYKRRRRKLLEILVNKGLLPDDYSQNPEKILNEIDRKYAERKLGKKWSNKWLVTEKFYCSSYAMRNFSLEEKLEPYEFGRLLLHLQRRRGYFSNRGAKYIDLIKSLNFAKPEFYIATLKDDTSTMADKEDRRRVSPVLSGIKKLRKKLGNRTIGQFIWEESQRRRMPPQRVTLFDVPEDEQAPGGKRLQLRAEREMHEKEFDAIWQKQNTFYKLSDEEARSVKEKIFDQRPLQLQKNKVGNCNIFPHKKRAAMARLEFQEFRTLQMINNIRIDGTRLDSAQRQQLLDLSNNPDELNNHGRISWKKIADALGVKRKAINYNRESDDGGKTGVPGNKTMQAISRSIGTSEWEQLSEKEQTELVEDLITMHNKKALYDRLIRHWKFPCYQAGGSLTEGALGLAMNEGIESDYGKHSLKAINALLPHLRRGLDYYRAVEEIGQRESITKPIKETEEDFLLSVQDVPNIANPIVQKALYEIRRVINSIIRCYGKPAIIRVEMAREMKSSKEHRKKIASRQRENRKLNETAEEEILKFYNEGNPNISLEEMRSGVRRVNPDDRNKYKMWKNEQEEKCLYCGKPISINDLFSGNAEIEHILPYTGFSQNYMNTVVSCYSCNAEKGQRTSYEAWGHDQDRWLSI